MLTVTDLHTYYGDSHVLQGVSLRVASGAVVALLGRNGVGKTTLCRSIVGFSPARAGRVLFDDVDISAWKPHQIARRHLGLVPQGRRVFPSLTVAEHLGIAARRGTGAVSWEPAKIFEVFPRLAERQHHRGGELSGGEQQMLAIARALVANPALLVMDEPTEGLAPAVITAVGHLIRRIRHEGTTVLLAEQNASFAVTLADYVYVMSRGRIVHESAPAPLWRNEAVKARWLGVPPPSAARNDEDDAAGAGRGGGDGE
jgi:branched-chain amino acid transport system ATP-binding protein